MGDVDKKQFDYRRLKVGSLVEYRTSPKHFRVLARGHDPNILHPAGPWKKGTVLHLDQGKATCHPVDGGLYCSVVTVQPSQLRIVS